MDSGVALESSVATMLDQRIRWKRTGHFKSDAKAAAEIIIAAQTETHDQMCQAKAIVDAARPEGSPIHDDFEWDDVVAAERNRADTARAMIRHLVVVVEQGEPEPLFCHIRIGETRGYMETRIALSRPDSRKALLDEARREAAAFRRKYSHLREMADVVRAIDRIVDGGDD